MRQIIAAFARNTVFANIVVSLFFLAGGLATIFMIKETFPEFSLDMITVTVPYPGADPEEIEEGISRKIEEAIEGVEGVNQYTTYSKENLGSAIIEVKENYDVKDVLDRIKSKVDSISTFPVDAEKPIITELLLKSLVMLLYVSGDMSEHRLKEFAEKMKDEIQQIPEISQVEIFGARDYEIGIEVSEKRLRKYGLTFNMIADAVQRSNLNLAGGTIRTKGEEIRVRTMGRKYTGPEFSSIVVIARPNGELITLDQVAVINDGFTEDPVIAKINGQRALIIHVFKTKEENALAISKAVKDFINKKKQQLPKGINLSILFDGTDMLHSRINMLVKNGIIGLCLVFMLLWTFLDMRLAFWAGLGIPISISGAMVILWAIGGTINMVSLFGFIMVLGIIVDDAIVVGEAIFVHRKKGDPPTMAAVEGVCEIGMPVIAAVTTTIIAFIPLAFIGGIMGKFIAILPAVTIACLFISLIECFIMLPAHLSHLPDPDIKDIGHNLISRWIQKFHTMADQGLERFIKHIYAPFIKQAISLRYVSLCTAVCLLLLTFGLIKSGLLKFEVFPEIDGFVVTSAVEFPSGTPPDVTRRAVEEVETAFMRLAGRIKTASGDPLVKSHLTIVGQTLGESPMTGPNFGGVQFILLDSEKRKIHSKDIMVMWEKEVGIIPGIKSLTFEGMEAGPPGAPIEIWIQGESMTDILAASDDLISRLHEFEGVYQVHSDFSAGKNEMRLTLKPEARTLGLTVNDLATQIQAGFFGKEALRLQRGRDDIRVKVRYSASERRRISDIKQVRIRTSQGHEIPLGSVANIEFSPGYSKITRTDGMRRVAVTASVNTHKANANEIIADLSSQYFKRLKSRYPGILISLQGEKKKMRESFKSLFIGFPLAIVGIFIIIATIFRSYAQPFIIMLTVPFGIIGGIIGHIILGYNLSLISIFGMVALSGVVVNDAIVLIEQINKNIARGIPFFDSIQQGGVRRFRAIFLTTISTAGGLAPLIMETDLQAKVLIPMAISLAAGVSFATILTLILIPSLLVILNDFRLIFHRLIHGKWTDRKMVEPARNRYADMLGDEGKTVKR